MGKQAPDSMDFYRVRFDVETEQVRSPTEHTPRVQTFYTDLLGHYPTAYDIRSFISTNISDNARIRSIRIEHEHYIHDRKEDR